NLPFGSDVSALIATFSTTGKLVHVGATPQQSGVTVNNFTKPLTYTVTAENNSTQNYQTTVTLSEKSSKDITFYSLNGVAGVINGTNITVNVPSNTDVTKLVATFSTTGKSVNIGATPQISGTTANNFASAQTYTIIAADDSTKNYTVNVGQNPDQVSANVSVNGTLASKIEIQQGAVVPITLDFKANGGTVSNLTVTSTDSNLTPASSTCAKVDSVGSCQITLILRTTKQISVSSLPVYFTYTGNSNQNSIKNFTYKVNAVASKNFNINHGKINSLTLKS
ncbi:MAG: hypothetical protein V4591_00005, partial [Bdellovibrionota bacterium]